MHELLEGVIHAVHEAGATVMRVYGREFAVRGKADASPVTDADEAAEALIVAALQRLAPAVPVVAEEAVAAGRCPALAPRFWLVDPLDGTKEFVQRNGEFTVNVALVEQGVPVLGVVLAPALARLYAGVHGQGAFAEQGGVRQPIRCRSVPPEGWTVVASRSHGDEQALAAFLRGARVAELRHVGSSLKLCLLAEGRADVYPRLGPTMAWDIAAGHAVLLAAGGRVTELDGRPLSYARADFRNPQFVACGATPWRA
ncbi:MAG: 3'(2'),5'-bisphosphate nucleotidase CysQ [Pseudomonadota bacterium]